MSMQGCNSFDAGYGPECGLGAERFCKQHLAAPMLQLDQQQRKSKHQHQPAINEQQPQQSPA
jgi:hypothetical protein